MHPPGLLARIRLAYQRLPHQIGLLSRLQGIGSAALKLRQVKVAGKRMPQSRSKDLLQGIPEFRLSHKDRLSGAGCRTRQQIVRDGVGNDGAVKQHHAFCDFPQHVPERHAKGAADGFE